ncbi:MAG: hypothetical protein AABO57_15910 [Acidobacteriota bacterium]
MTTDSNAARQAALESFNHAIEALQGGNREEAAKHYQRAFDSILEEEAQDRAFKAFVAYQYGVCLLKLHGIDQQKGSRATSPSHQDATANIKHLWEETLRLFNSVNKSTIDDIDRQFPLSSAVHNIASDPLMQDVILPEMIEFAFDLARQGQKAEAVEMLTSVLRKLDEANPDHKVMLAKVHNRLATLCSDTRDKQEAADHAEWVLKNAPPIDETMQMVMELILEQAGRNAPTISQPSASPPQSSATFSSPANAKAGGGCSSLLSVLIISVLALILAFFVLR